MLVTTRNPEVHAHLTRAGCGCSDCLMPALPGVIEAVLRYYASQNAVQEHLRICPDSAASLKKVIHACATLPLYARLAGVQLGNILAADGPGCERVTRRWAETANSISCDPKNILEMAYSALGCESATGQPPGPSMDQLAFLDVVHMVRIVASFVN